jgi:hypothetical protein
MPALATSPAITDLSHLPVILIVQDIARIYRRAIGTIRRDCQRGTFYPPPKWERPYRWLRADVERDLDRRSDEAMAQLTPSPPAVTPAAPSRRRRRR